MYVAEFQQDSRGAAISGLVSARGHSAPSVPREILNRLAKTIQLMRLEHVDAHLYRSGCDALVQSALQGSTTLDLEATLTDIMRHVEDGDYHWALMELRALTQMERIAC